MDDEHDPWIGYQQDDGLSKGLILIVAVVVLGLAWIIFEALQSR